MDFKHLRSAALLAAGLALTALTAGCGGAVATKEASPEQAGKVGTPQQQQQYEQHMRDRMRQQMQGAPVHGGPGGGSGGSGGPMGSSGGR
jgi:hypothetical protein